MKHNSADYLRRNLVSGIERGTTFDARDVRIVHELAKIYTHRPNPLLHSLHTQSGLIPNSFSTIAVLATGSPITLK